MKDKKYNLFNKKTILITGGTGSFGSMFVTNVLKKSKPKLIIIYSRDEMKQWKMQEKFKVYNNFIFHSVCNSSSGRNMGVNNYIFPYFMVKTCK